MRPFIIAVVAVACALAVAVAAGAQERPGLGLPPTELVPGAELIALETGVSPDGATLLATYGNEADTVRTGVAVNAPESPILHWGRITTADGVNNAALGIVPAWDVPADFDRDAFLAATGCTDARLVSTDTPRTDMDTNELGWTADFAQPAADNPVTGHIVLCLTAGGHIVQVASFGPTGGEPLAPVAELTLVVVEWVGDDPSEPPTGVDCPPPPDDGEFRPMAVIDDC